METLLASVDIKLEEGEYDEPINFPRSDNRVRTMCPQCGTEVLDVKQHIKRVHNKKPEILDLSCTDCGKKCTNRNQLTLHWNYVHKVVDNLFCNLCSKPCSNMSKLRQHTLTCLARIQKQQPHLMLPRDMKSFNVRQATQPLKVIVIPCNLCKKAFSQMKNLKRHTIKCVAKHLGRLASEEKPKNLDEEKSVKENDRVSSPNKESTFSSIKQELRCPDCSEPCFGIGSLIKHRMKCFNQSRACDDDEIRATVDKKEPICDLVVKEEAPENSNTLKS